MYRGNQSDPGGDVCDARNFYISLSKSTGSIDCPKMIVGQECLWLRAKSACAKESDQSNREVLGGTYETDGL